LRHCNPQIEAAIHQIRPQSKYYRGSCILRPTFARETLSAYGTSIQSTRFDVVGSAAEQKNCAENSETRRLQIVMRRIAASSTLNAISFSSARTVKAVSILAVSVSNPARSPFGIKGQPQLQPALLRVIGDCFPILRPVPGNRTHDMPMDLNSGLEFEKARQLLIGIHKKASSVLTLCGHNPIDSPSSSVLEIQPQREPAFLSLSAIVFQFFLILSAV
jgi:hypothetical protein